MRPQGRRPRNRILMRRAADFRQHDHVRHTHCFAHGGDMPTRALWFFLFFTFVIGAFSRSHGQEYAIGADVSFARQAEQQGSVFKENGVATPVLDMLNAHGYNWVRLRLFYTPTDLPNNLDYTIATAKAAKKLGFHTLLDLHYSDTWADPAKKFTPKP